MDCSGNYHLDCVPFAGTVLSLALSVERRSSRMVGADSPVPVPPCVPELRSRPSPAASASQNPDCRLQNRRASSV